MVATDSDEVASAVRAHGGEVSLTSPDHPSGTDRVAEVVARREFARFESVLNVQGDEPFVSAAALEGAVSMVTSGRFELGTAAVLARPDILQVPSAVKVVTADDGRAMYFSRAAIPFLREPQDTVLLARRVRQHVGVYAYEREALARWVALPPHPLEQIERLEQLRPLAHGMAMGVALIDEPLRAGIDTEADLERANAEWSQFTG